MKPRFFILLANVFILTALFGNLALAQTPTDTETIPKNNVVGNAANNLDLARGSALGTDENPLLSEVVARVIQVVLSIVGLIFIGLIIYGGYEWGTARGNEEKVNTGKKLIFEATVGVIIIFGAYFLTAFIIQRLAIATFTPATPSF